MNHKRYFLFQFKRDLPLLALILGVLLVIGTIIGLEETHANFIAEYGRNAFTWLIWSSYLLAYLFPLAHKRKFFNKRSCDLYLSLPVTKKGLYLDDAILGFLEILLETTLFYACLMLFSPLTLDNGWIRASYAGYAYGYLLLALLVGYLTSLGITSCANSLLDALILLSLYVLYQFLLGGVIISSVPYGKAFFYDGHSISIDQYYTFPALYFEQSLLVRTFNARIVYEEGAYPVWWALAHLGFALGFAIVGYFLSKKWHPEESQSPSRHFYGYPLFAGLAMSVTVGINFRELGTPNWSTVLIQVAIGSLIYWIIAFIGERKIRFNWMNLSFYFGGVIEGFLLAVALNSSFGAWLPNVSY